MESQMDPQSSCASQSLCDQWCCVEERSSKFACVKRNRCKSCDVPGTETTDFTHQKAGDMRGCNLEERGSEV